MSIRGKDTAIQMAIERASRTNQPICVVQIGKDDYVLWRQDTTVSLPLVYPHYKIVKTIRIRNDDIR
jgi:hypothetical protein